METIVKVYEITYIYGVVNPVEKKFILESINYPNENYIRKELIKKKVVESQIINICSVILVEEKILNAYKDNNKDKSEDSIPTFNW